MQLAQILAKGAVARIPTMVDSVGSYTTAGQARQEFAGRRQTVNRVEPARGGKLKEIDQNVV